jgi:hypothetical protein
MFIGGEKARLLQEGEQTLDKLQQALLAHEKQLEEAQRHKTGRSALVGAQRKRVRFLQKLIADCEQRQQLRESRSTGRSGEPRGSSSISGEA